MSSVDSDHAKSTVVAPSALPISDKPVTLSFSKGPVKLNAGLWLSITHISLKIDSVLATGSSKIPVLGFSMDDSNTADDAQDEPPSEPSKRVYI